MALALPSFETSFINDFSKTYIDEISFSRETYRDMGRYRVGLPDIVHVLQEGRVLVANKEDIDGAHWTVGGETTEERNLLVRIQVWPSNYRVRVLSIGLN